MTDKQELLEKIQAELELRREEKQKKEALNYFTAAYIDKVKEQEEIAREEKYGKFPFLETLSKQSGKKLPQMVEALGKLAEVLSRTVERKTEFFDFDEKAPENKEVADFMKEMQLEKKHIATFALCEAEDKMEKVMDFVSGRMSREESEKNRKELEEIRSSSFIKAREAIQKYRNGDHKDFGKKLVAGIRNACKHYCKKKIKPDEAMEWSENVNEMIYMAEKNPNLMKENGMTDEQIRAAKEIAQAYLPITKAVQGTQMLEEMLAGSASFPKEIQEEYKNMLNDSIEGMRKIMNDREKYAIDWDAPVQVKAPEAPQLVR